MIWTVLFALLVFSLIIFVHELGHFLTARLFKVKVHEFAIGMGPKIFSSQRGETVYSLRAIPIGGFCSMEGENEQSSDEGSFSGKPWYAKLIVLAAGASMNIILGFFITVVFVAILYKGTGIPSVTVDKVHPESALYGIMQPGDRILSLNGSRVNIKRDIDFAMQQSGGEECEIVFSRDGKKQLHSFVPYKAQYMDGTPAYLVGFTPAISKPSAFGTLREAFYQTIWMGKTVFVSIGMLINGEAGISDMSGPVGVVGTMNTAMTEAMNNAADGQGRTAGLLALLSLASFISVNIGIMNLLPIPALDGGRIFFVLVEAVRRKPIPPEKEGVVHFVGLVLLLGFMVFVTWNDIIKLFG